MFLSRTAPSTPQSRNTGWGGPPGVSSGHQRYERIGAMGESEGIRGRCERFLQVAYDLSINEPVPMVRIETIARELGADPETARDPTGEAMRMAHYWGNKGHIKSEADGYGHFSLTPEGIDEVEGKNKPQEPATSNVINISGGNFYSSAVGVNNSANLSAQFDFRTIEQRIESEAGPDREELLELVADMQEMVEKGETLDRNSLSRYNDKLKEYDWLFNAVAGWLLNFATSGAG